LVDDTTATARLFRSMKLSQEMGRPPGGAVDAFGERAFGADARGGDGDPSSRNCTCDDGGAAAAMAASM
jgi:hypothetical protein